MGVSERLAAAGHTLPTPPEALGLYLPARRTGSLVLTAGQLPMRDGALMVSGRVGAEVDEDTARACAAQAALCALAAAATVCDLEAVTAVVKLTGYVASEPGFSRQSAVVDGASEIMDVAFGALGRHARVAVGVSGLPLGSPVEIEVVLEVPEGP